MKNGLEIDRYGNKFWYINGLLHRDDGPAIDCYSGTKEWYQNGLLHRLDGPAGEYASGTKFWYQNGLIHRLDGPAVEYACGSKFWWINDKKIDCSTQEEFEKLLKLKAFW